MSDDAFALLRAHARINAAVFRARERLVSARAGVACAKRDLRERRTTPARLAEEALREAAAEDALRDAVEAWARDGHRLRDAYSDALRALGSRGPKTTGASFGAALAALTARFGPPDPGDADHRSARWTRDVWTEERPRSRAAWRAFGVCDDCRGDGPARVRIYGEASGCGRTLVGGASVEILVGVEPHLADAIHHAWLPRGAEYTLADPGPYGSRAPGADRDHWIPWAFDAPETAAGLLRPRSGSYGPPHLAPLPLAVEAVALMLDAPRPPQRENA